MSHDFAAEMNAHFRLLSDDLLNAVRAPEELSLGLEAEDTLYVRFNGNLVRQNTDVRQMILTLRLQNDGRSAERARTLTGDPARDRAALAEALRVLREELNSLPADPNQVAFENHGQSRQDFRGRLPSAAEMIADVHDAAAGSDLAGLYAGGTVISANRNSHGQDHWFATQTFFLDYSLYNGERAAKAVFAGSHWSSDEWRKNLARAKAQLALLSRPLKNVKPGAYRTYLAPGAMSEIVGHLAWGALSAGACKQGRSAFKKLADGERRLSPLFTLRENFELGLTPRFNAIGEVAPPMVTLIENGQFREFLTSSRTAKEFGLRGNGAGDNESPRSPELMPGTLQEQEILRELDHGLYLSNLHYLNWSDPVAARVTGMTRYACFWVEKGEIVGPIKDLRFDESLYDAFGGKLTGLTAWAETDPSVSTYFARSLGGKRVPGALIEDMTFTL